MKPWEQVLIQNTECELVCLLSTLRNLERSNKFMYGYLSPKHNPSTSLLETERIPSLHFHLRHQGCSWKRQIRTHFSCNIYFHWTRFQLWVEYKTGLAMNLTFQQCQQISTCLVGHRKHSNKAVPNLMTNFFKSREENALLESKSSLGVVFGFLTREDHGFRSLASSLPSSTRGK